MFKFDFDLDDEVDVDDLNLASLRVSDDQLVSTSTTNNLNLPNVEIPISQLLDVLPQVLSYSPLSDHHTLARRDLFDARFQLISEGHDDSNNLQFLDAPSDLVPGVYEGGLKTWECSLDLVDYLESSGLSMSIVGKRVLEVGCGTAVPSMYLLREILSLPTGSSPPLETRFHLQDYNSSVLELITLPNLLITWYLSPASATYHAGHDNGPPNPSVPSEIEITPELKSAFLSSFKERNITLRFFSGSWETFDLTSIPQGGYDIVLTSETIYRAESLPSLIALLRSTCLGDEQIKNTLCLVAAKVVYFGVGGGVSDFKDAVEGEKSHKKLGNVETVWETNTGVKKKILSVTWTY